jgi:hypothetical protein
MAGERTHARPQPSNHNNQHARPAATSVATVGNQQMQRSLRQLGAGAPLVPLQRDAAESRLVTDLGGVRLHTGSGADTLARGLGASAVTDGINIALSADTHRGGILDPAVLGHELVHVAQQSRLPFAPGGRLVSQHGDPDETEARAYAAEVFRSGPPLGLTATPSAALRRDGPHAPPASTPPTAKSQARTAPETGRQVPLATLLAPGAAWQPDEPWGLVFAIFRDGGSPQIAGLLVRRLIARRWFEGQGIDPNIEMVTLTTVTPPGPTVFPAERVYRIRDHDVPAGPGDIDLPALEQAFGTHALEAIVGETAREAESVGQAAALQAEVTSLAERVPAFAARIRGSFADARLGEVQAFQRYLSMTYQQAVRVVGMQPAAQFATGVDTALAGDVAIVTGVLAELTAWRVQHPRGVTASEFTEDLAKKNLKMQQDLQGQYGGVFSGYMGEAAMYSAMASAEVDLVGGRTQRDIAEAYDRGEVSFNEMEDLQHCAAIRTAVVGVVTIALAVATAGIGGAVVGGLGLASEGTLAFSVLGGAVEGGFGAVEMMGTEHFLTSARDFDNPAAQSIWRRGAYTPSQYLMGFGMGFGMGGVMGAGGHFLFGPPPGTGGAMVPFEPGMPFAARPPGAVASAEAGALARVPPAYDVLSDILDPATGVRTIRARMANGELVSFVADGAGNGYMVRGNGEMVNIVQGRMGGPVRGLGPGEAAPLAPDVMTPFGTPTGMLPSGPGGVPAPWAMLPPGQAPFGRLGAGPRPPPLLGPAPYEDFADLAAESAPGGTTGQGVVWSVTPDGTVFATPPVRGANIYVPEGPVPPGGLFAGPGQQRAWVMSGPLRENYSPFDVFPGESASSRALSRARTGTAPNTRGQAGELFVQRASGGQREVEFGLPAGLERRSDVVSPSVAGSVNQEVKNYLRYIGQGNAAREVRLTPFIQTEINRDAMIMYYYGQQAVWVFTDAPPAAELAAALQEARVPYVIASDRLP